MLADGARTSPSRLDGASSAAGAGEAGRAGNAGGRAAILDAADRMGDA